MFASEKSHSALQHSLPVLLFELVQIRTAPKAVSCSSRVDTVAPAQQQQQSSSLFHPSPPSIAVISASSVRVVIARANSVFGTAAVKPCSLWRLGPASPSHQDYPFSHGYRRYRSSRSGGKIDAGTFPNHGRHPGEASLHPSRPDTPFQSHQLHSGQQEDDLAATVGYGTRFCENGMSRTQDKRTTESHSNKYSRVLRRDSTDILDEVGFGAHIDKSTAAAGDQ